MQVIAHRGASAYAPENTFAAFDLALEMEAPAFETDVQATRDGVLVLFHDGRVERTTNGQGTVKSLTYAELSALDAGSWFDPRFAGERVPRLDAFLDRYGKQVHLALEMKAGGIEEAILEAVCSRGLLEQVTFTSFSFESCCVVLSLALQARVGLLYGRTNVALARALVAAGFRQACPNASSLTKADVEMIRAHGLAVRTWGVPTEELMHKVVNLGVDGTTINFPDRLLEVLASGA